MNNNTAARRPDEEKSEDYIVGSIEVADVMNPEKQVVSLTTAHKEDESNNVITSVESASQSPVDVSSHVISAGFVCPLEMKMSEGPVDSTNDSTMSHPTSVLFIYLFMPATTHVVVSTTQVLFSSFVH
eukprot:m.1351541 g.1351541  ORF g.1351541 m.1351541 type:complete len:128 (+) comp24923_c0_seq20:205-588(+)